MFEQRVARRRMTFGMVLVLLAGVLAASMTAGCIDLGAGDLLPSGTPFAISGVAQVADAGGPTIVWLGDNGVTYHLFQDPLLDNDLFDRVTTAGVRSRLVLTTRSDLVVVEKIGTIVEVQTVLEVIQ